jgi:hypothetical protein
MAFDATVGGANSTSYLTVDRADEIAAERLHTTAWGALSTPQKQSALMFASRLFTTRVSICAGEVTYSDQALLFPRSGLTNRNGTVVASDTIPIDVEYSVFEWVLRIIPSDTSVESDVSAQGITKIKAGPVELSFDKELKLKSVPENVISMIPADWLCPTPIDWSPVSAEFRVY